MDLDRALEELRVHRAELELQNAELQESQLRSEQLHQRYALLFEHLPIPVLRVDGSGVVLEGNGAVRRLFGLSSRQLQQHTVYRLLSHRDDDTLARLFDRHSRVPGPGSSTTAALVALHTQAFDEHWFEVRLHRLPVSRDSGERPSNLLLLLDQMPARELQEVRRSERSLRDSESRLRMLTERARDVVWRMTPDGRITYFSPAVEEVFGFSVDEAMALPLSQLLVPSSYAVAVAYVCQVHLAVAEGRAPEVHRGEHQYRCKDGSVVWAEVIVCPIVDDAGRLVELTGVSRDLSAVKAEQARLEAGLQRVQRMLDHVPTPVVVSEAGAVEQLLFLNQAFQDAFGYSAEDVPTLRHWLQRVFPDEAQRRDFEDSRRGELMPRPDQAQSSRMRARELPVLCKDGSSRRVVMRSGRIDDMIVSSLVDITEIRRTEADLRQAREMAEEANRSLQAANDQLSRIAGTDPLTGLANRRLFGAELAAAVARADRTARPLSLILFDIDRFKSINDRFGHLEGDRVLAAVAAATRAEIRLGDMLARWGGEEFALLLTDDDAEQAMTSAERLRLCLRSCRLDGIGTVTASFGVAERGPGEDVESWIRRADAALYAAKQAGRDACRLAPAASAGGPD